MAAHFKSYRFLSVLVLIITPLLGLAAGVGLTDGENTPSSNISTAGHRASAASPTSFHDESVFDSGVIGLGGYYEQSYGFDALIASYLGDSRSQAFAFEFNGGSKLFRENVTYGLALTNQQRIKMTYERLDEKQDLGFHTGTVTRWNGQNAIGGDYAYMLQSNWLERVGFGGYFTHSASKNLSDVDFTEGGKDKVEHRRIAGATSMNIHTDTAVRLWPQSRLSGGLDYDSVHFNTKYDNHNADTHGFGGHLQVEQRVLPQVKLTANSHMQTNEQSYGGSVGWLLPTNLPMELVATTAYIDNKATKTHFWHNGVRMNVALGSDDNAGHGAREYTDLSAGAKQSLLDWTRTPAVRMSTVLTTADYTVEEKSSEIVHTTSTRNVDLPTNDQVHVFLDSNPALGSTMSSGWIFFYESGSYQVNELFFTRAVYNSEAKEVTASYNDTIGGHNGNGLVKFKYSNVTDKPKGGAWRNGLCEPSSKDPSECQIQVSEDV